MLRLDPSCAVFTSTHLLLVRLCLRARAYSCALPVLDKHICHLPTLTGRAHSNSSQSHPCATHDSSLSFMTDTSGLSSRLSYRDYLQYFLCGGMVYMALKRWHQAFHFLGIVICLPTAGSISKVMVEAYKKFILVGLLEQGKVSDSIDLLIFILIVGQWLIHVAMLAPEYHDPTCGEDVSVTCTPLCLACPGL